MGGLRSPFFYDYYIILQCKLQYVSKLLEMI